MAVVEQKSNLYRDQLAMDPPIANRYKKGIKRYATGSVSHLATDSALSTYRLADLPYSAILHPDTFFDVENLGFAQVQIGTLTDATALVDQTQATENVVTPIAQGDANHGKELWEVLGLADNPSGFCALFFTAAANATGAGSIDFQLAWIDDQ